MAFRLSFTNTAAGHLAHLAQHNKPKRKKVNRALGYLETNPRHPSLNTHEFTTMKGPQNEKVYEAYVENQTPGAYRIFFYYPTGEREKIMIVAITPHP